MKRKPVEPYAGSLDPNAIYTGVRPVKARVVAVLRLELDDRKLQLIVQKSRALREGDIVEMAVTDEPGAAPGAEVNSVGYLGFVEITQGGVVLTGEEVSVTADGNRGVIGNVVGFDETHIPNHMNVIVRVPLRTTGKGMQWEIGQEVEFSFGRETQS